MTTESFTEQFPELKTENCNCDDTSIEDLHLHQSTIKKHCLSKQRVKEAIELWCMALPMDDLNDLLKELGLEE